MSDAAVDELERRLRAHGRFDAPPIAAAGDKIGDWKILAFLGRGGSAEVYRAENAATGIVGALKILYRADDKARARFRREARLAAELSGSAFPKFYGAGEDSGRLYLAEELLEPIEKGKRPPRSARRKKPKPPPLHKEPELTSEEKADIEDAFKNAREANEAYEKNRKKLPLAQTSDLRQIEELKRGGMSGDEIASRFGIDRVKEYNAAHSKNPIKTSKHSKPGAPEFAW